MLAEKTSLGRRLTGALCSFGFASALSNLGLLPASSSVYNFCWSHLLPASLAVTILSGVEKDVSSSGNQKENYQRQGGVGLAFAVGSAGSVLGARSAFALATTSALPWPALRLARPLAARCAGACAATYVGGSANLFYVARATGLATDGATLGALAASDVALMGVREAQLAKPQSIPQQLVFLPELLKIRNCHVA